MESNKVSGICQKHPLQKNRVNITDRKKKKKKMHSKV